jgi:hypothetical protein
MYLRWASDGLTVNQLQEELYDQLSTRVFNLWICAEREAQPATE